MRPLLYTSVAVGIGTGIAAFFVAPFMAVGFLVTQPLQPVVRVEPLTAASFAEFAHKGSQLMVVLRKGDWCVGPENLALARFDERFYAASKPEEILVDPDHPQTACERAALTAIQQALRER